MKQIKNIRFVFAVSTALVALLCVKALEIDGEGWHSFFIGVVGGCLFVPITSLGVTRSAILVLVIFAVFMVIPPSDAPRILRTDLHVFIGSSLGLAVAELGSQLLNFLYNPRKPRI